MAKTVCEALIEGGKASAGPPIAPVLGPTGANLYQIVQEINRLTADLKGLKVPVKITVDTDTKEFEIEIGLPPTSALILKEAGVEKGTASAGNEVMGNITLEQAITVVKAKEKDLLGTSLVEKVKSVLGTCVSMGITVEGKEPRIVQQEIDEGTYASQLQSND
ncbi:MAG: 50S ribosomal protein L11 [Promethearchaeota archaeon]